MPCWCHAPTCHIMSLGCLAVMQYAQGPGHDGGCACMHVHPPPWSSRSQLVADIEGHALITEPPEPAPEPAVAPTVAPCLLLHGMHDCFFCHAEQASCPVQCTEPSPLQGASAHHVPQACMHAHMRLQEPRWGFQLWRVEAGMATAISAVAHVTATPHETGAKAKWGKAVEEPIAWCIWLNIHMPAWRGDALHVSNWHCWEHT